MQTLEQDAPQAPRIKRRERDTVLSSLQAGLVPSVGLHLLQVGRKPEITAMLNDLQRIAETGAGFRVVVGRFGSGKTFFLSLIRAVATQQKMVVAQADFTMQRRLYSNNGATRALYTELVRNLSTKARPDGNALRSICESWISSIQHEVKTSGGSTEQVEERILEDLKVLRDFVGGYEFADVMRQYYKAFIEGDDAKQDCALRWIRAEYATKTDARNDLGVRRIIDDSTVYDSLKLLAKFFVVAGYKGLIVNVDEMVVLSHRLPNVKARQNNYEAFLTILNDCLQGKAENIGFIFGATDECLEDPRRGLFSYEALRSRLDEGDFVREGLVDLCGPVIRLQSLDPEELLVLLEKVCLIHAQGDAHKVELSRADLSEFMEKANSKLGAEYFRTPRDIIRSIVKLLNVIEQNPGYDWRKAHESGVNLFVKESPSSVEEEVDQGIDGNTPQAGDDPDDDLQNFRL